MSNMWLRQRRLHLKSRNSTHLMTCSTKNERQTTLLQKCIMLLHAYRKRINAVAMIGWNVARHWAAGEWG